MKRGVVDPRCNLPGRVALGQIAAAHGLFEGLRSFRTIAMPKSTSPPPPVAIAHLHCPPNETA